jgi:hypothetical protein
MDVPMVRTSTTPLVSEVFRPSNSTWYQLRSTSGIGWGCVWGAPGDQPM